MKPVLFTSNNSLQRAENIKAVFEAYDGEKEFIHTNPWKKDERIGSNAYSMRVCDEFIGASPGKAIMIGHAISGGKTYGLDQPHPYHKRSNARLLDFVVTSSEKMIPLVAKQSGVHERQVLPLGTPRTDVYFRVKRKKESGKRIYLYAPTFRNREETPMPMIDWRYIDERLTDEEVFIVKPHMVTKTILKGESYRHIIEVDSQKPSIPYLVECDVLITDYSSIMLDAHLLKVPVVLLEKAKGYLKNRGMYLPYPEGYASRYCTTERELIDVIRDADGQGIEDIACLEKTANACDGHATERVRDLIRSML